MNRILVIRGGAIGDFILTLPALKLLRENFRHAQIEILGYKQIIALAENRYYANATPSIDYAPLSRFFVRNAELPADLIEYFASFDLVVSYLFDPDEIFSSNMKRCGVRRFISQSPKITDQEHAARQLARPLKQIGLCLDDAAPVLYPNEADRLAARKFLGRVATSLVALHPGSGSETKNWPIENWIALGEHLLSSESSRVTLVVVSGEADERQTARLRSLWKEKPVCFATNLPLPHLAALLEGAIFVGHDSGISHLAAAVGAHCVLLFGATDPAIWAPAGNNVKIIRAPKGNLCELRFEIVRDSVGMTREEKRAKNPTS
jgi:heptosyltransferase-3